MKKLLYILCVLLVGLGVSACRDSLSEKYTGEPELHFSKETSSKQMVIVGGGDVNVPITVGTIVPVTSDQTFQLVVDTSKSTAVEGVDFILSPGTIASGKAIGTANIKLIESAASKAGKTVVFKLKSSTLANAVFDDTYTMTIKLGCNYTQSTFIGNAKVLEDVWQDYNVGDSVPIVAGTTSNQLYVKQTNNTSLDNSATAYLIVTIKDDGTAVVTANEPFKYGTSSFAITGTGTVDTCSGEIDLLVNYGTSYKNQKLRLKK